MSTATLSATTATQPFRILYLSFITSSLQETCRDYEFRMIRAVARATGDGRRPPGGGGPGRAAASVSVPHRANKGKCAPMFYSEAMPATVMTPPDDNPRIFAWPRVRFTLIAAAAFGFLTGLHSKAPMPLDIARAIFVGLAVLAMFGFFEQFPRRMPRWLPRTVLRLIAIAIIIPISSGIVIALTGGATEHDYGLLLGGALLIAPWIAIGTILRQRDAFAREQALEFELVRSEFERRESDARLRLLQAQVEPHFLFNTLANVQALVDSGSPQASKVLKSLIAYLRAAVPRMHSKSVTVASEVELVRAYLELMQMRMPDRLQFAIHLEPGAAPLQCPPMTLLTLVENAVRHGIDPGETGGRIDIHVERHGARCTVRVVDTGVGLGASSGGLGTGLSTLRERLQLVFGGAAELRVRANAPRGVVAEIEIPAERQA